MWPTKSKKSGIDATQKNEKYVTSAFNYDDQDHSHWIRHPWISLRRFVPTIVRQSCRRERTITAEIQQFSQAVRRGGSGVSGSLYFQWFGPIFSLQPPQASPSKQNPPLAGPMHLQVAPAKLRIFSVAPPRFGTLLMSSGRLALFSGESEHFFFVKNVGHKLKKRF